MADKIALLNAGKIVQIDTPLQALSQAGKLICSGLYWQRAL